MMDIKYSLVLRSLKAVAVMAFSLATFLLDSLIDWTNRRLASLCHFFCQVLLSARFNLAKRFQT